MNDLILIYIITCAFICVLTGLLLVYRYYLGNRLNAQANKLKSQMANIRQNFPELQEKRGELVASGLGDIGIEGILEQFNINPSILKSPIVKGLIERYAPRVLEQLSKQTKGNNENPQPEGF
jgi:hypothetical protein